MMCVRVLTGACRRDLQVRQDLVHILGSVSCSEDQDKIVIELPVLSGVPPAVMKVFVEESETAEPIFDIAGQVK